MREDEMGSYHQLNGHEFEQTPEDGDGQRSLADYSAQSHKESDTTEVTACMHQRHVHNDTLIEEGSRM